MDPRDLDTSGLLMAILEELQIIRMALEGSSSALAATKLTPPLEEKPSQRWRATLGFMSSIEQFVTQPEVDSIVEAYQDAASGGVRVVYLGRKLPNAEEA